MNRRSFLRGGLVLLAAPAIVRVASIMPVRTTAEPVWFFYSCDWTPLDSAEVERLLSYCREEMVKIMYVSDPLI